MQTLTKLVPVHLTADHLAALERIRVRHGYANRSDTIRRIIESADVEKARKPKGKRTIPETSANS